MKEDLLTIILEIVKLLSLCGWKSKAEWFREKAERIQALDINSQEFRTELLQLNRIIAGMGSFDDLPLFPNKESGLSKEGARLKQTELALKLGEAIEKLLHLDDE
jgi:hypothetical protein